MGGMGSGMGSAGQSNAAINQVKLRVLGQVHCWLSPPPGVLEVQIWFLIDPLPDLLESLTNLAYQTRSRSISVLFAQKRNQIKWDCKPSDSAMH